MQGPIGVMDPNVASALHSITDFSSAALLQASSDAVPHANGYLGPSVLASAWARRNDPRSSHSSVASLDSILGSPNGIKAETDLASIRRQNGSGVVISEALLDARTHVLEQDAFTGRHGKHVWWYAWTLKSSGKVNDTVLYRQVLGPIGLIGNLTSGVTARMMTGFTRTGGDMFYDMLAMVAPARYAIATPSPVAMSGFDVYRYTFPQPPVANATLGAEKVLTRPVSLFST